jgi:hypothetical protein
MTTEVEERLVPAPLTNPVPGAWIQLPDRNIPPVYVPLEPQHMKDERTGKTEVVGHVPGAHIKRLLSEGAMYSNGPVGLAPQQNVELASTEAALRAELDQMKAEREHFMKEMIELRAKMEADQGVPNATKKAR